MLRRVQGHDNVRLACGKAGKAREHQQLDVEIGMLVDQTRQPRRQDQGAESFRRAYAHGAADAHALPQRFLAQQADVVLDRLGVRKQPLAGLGQHVAVGRRFEQPASQRCLELLDSPGNGCVIDVQLAADMVQPFESGELQEESQIIPVHEPLWIFAQCMRLNTPTGGGCPALPCWPVSGQVARRIRDCLEDEHRKIAGDP